MKTDKRTLTIPENTILTNSSKKWYFYYKCLEDDYTISFKKYEYESKKEAERNYLKIVKEFDSKISTIRNSIDISFSFKSYLQYWLYEVQYPKVANRRKVVLNHMVNNIIIPSMPENPLLTRVTTAYLDKLFATCKGHSETSGWMSQLVISTVLKSAIADQYLKANPMDGIKRFKRNKPNFQVISNKDIPKFLTEAKLYGMNSTSSEGLYLEILLGLFCGIRRGEIMGLRFDDFDVENQTVTIKRQLSYIVDHSVGENGDKFSRKGVATICPKTDNSYRCLKIHSVIFEELEKRKQLIEIYKDRDDYIHDNDGYVCLLRNGAFKTDSAISSGVKKIALRSGIPPVSCHDLRHTCATMLMEFGVEIPEIAKVLGHTNPHTTLDLYCTTTESEQDIAELFDDNLILSNTEGAE